ncbi:DUF5906 domain-containing protein [Olivibacter jilunii]
MQNYKISKDDILQHTNGGLDIFRFYIKDIDDYAGTRKKFKLHEENTPSSSIKKMSDGNWVVADFGDDGRWRNGIAFAQKMERLDFGDTIKLLANRHGIASAEQVDSMFAPKFSSSDAKPDQPNGHWEFEYLDEVPESWLKILFADKVWAYIEYKYRNVAGEAERKEEVLKELREILLKQHWHALSSYTMIKDRKATKIESAEYYPIFCIEETTRKGDKDVTFRKIYQPKAAKKKNRFFYNGDFDPKFLHGLMQAEKMFQELQDEKAAEEPTEKKDDDDNEVKLEEIIYCTGGSDALNLSALGYYAVYPASEYFRMDPRLLKKLFSLAKNVYTCPDLDETGQRQNFKLCMDPEDERYLDIKVVELPAALQEHRDNYDRPCKDVRDYLKYYKAKDFRNLVKSAREFRFWDMHKAMDKNGSVKMKFGRPVYEYKLSNERVYKFLQRNGFYRHMISDDVEEFIHISGNLVQVVKAPAIKGFLVDFLRERFFPEELINLVHRSPQLNEASFSALDTIDLNFTDYEKTEQYMFFKNGTWRIDTNGIEVLKPADVKRKVWESKILPWSPTKLPPMFTITQDKETGDFDIEIHNQECLFFRFLINTSRIFWRKEFEDNLVGKSQEEQDEYHQAHRFDIAGPNLADHEIRIQKMHLMNKIYAIGYLMHRYKNPSRPWCVFSMDDKKSEDGLSHGGSGKSIFGKAVSYFKTTVNFDGRDNDLFKDKHVFERVNRQTDLLIFDDAGKYFAFERLFSIITGDLVVNPKGKSHITLTFNETGKMLISTNFTPTELSPTVLRRLLFTGFSDFYHVSNNGEYNETHQPFNDFNKNLFDDFTPNEWNLFINFMAQCCQAFLVHEKIEAPMENMNARNLQSVMGVSFLMWAESYFSEESGRRDAFVPVHVALEDYKRECGVKMITTQGFNQKVKAFAQLKNLINGPKELLNKDGRIAKYYDALEFDNRNKKWFRPGNKKTTNFYYLQTPGKELTENICDPTKGDEPPLPSVPEEQYDF